MPWAITNGVRSDPTGTPTDGVPITDLTLEKITGSVSSDAAPCTYIHTPNH